MNPQNIVYLGLIILGMVITISAVDSLEPSIELSTIPDVDTLHGCEYGYNNSEQRCLRYDESQQFYAIKYNGFDHVEGYIHESDVDFNGMSGIANTNSTESVEYLVITGGGGSGSYFGGGGGDAIIKSRLSYSPQQAFDRDMENGVVPDEYVGTDCSNFASTHEPNDNTAYGCVVWDIQN